MGDLKIDRELLLRFEEGLDPRYPERSTIPAAVLGYGEMSTVFEIGEEGQRELAYKRMPIFESVDEVTQYKQIYNEYNELLINRVGLHIPPYDSAVITTAAGRQVMFDIQKKLDPLSMGNRVIEGIAPDEVFLMVRLILRELKKIWDFNRKSKELEIGIDGQISNWAIAHFDPKNPTITERTEFFYIDTSTPLFRKDGGEQLNPELFLRAAPSFLVWLIRWLFLEDVMTRYYDFHLVAIDLIGNFYKEQRPELIPRLIEVSNDFFENEAEELGIEPITEKEVKSYYREDAWIWRLFLAFRKIDRFLKTRIARKPYPFILPGKIKR
jgi:hypothetical protein